MISFISIPGTCEVKYINISDKSLFGIRLSRSLANGSFLKG